MAPPRCSLKGTLFVIRIRLLASCLADPTGIKFRGYEVDVSEEQAAPLLATGQWERVAPPAPAEPEAPEMPEPPETGDWTTTPEAAAVPSRKPKREYRRK